MGTYSMRVMAVLAARNGSRCGARSAYSRPGGRAPLCYPSDVTDAMVEKYRKQCH